jgi:rhamnose transport system permease protein
MEKTMNLKLLYRHETILFLILVCVMGTLAVYNDRFLTSANLLNQGRLMTEVGLIVIAMTFVIITGGIDLSVGSTVGLSAILVGVFWKLGLPLPLAAFLAIVVGSVGGFLNGLIITRFRVPPLIATLATLALYRGLAEGISQAQSVRGYPAWFLSIGQGNLFGVPTQLWLLGVVAISGIFILRFTPVGRKIYAIGNNEAAARYSGVDVARIKLWIYAGSGCSPASPRSSSSAVSRPPARTWAPVSSSMRSPPWCWEARRSSAGAARSSARCSGLC